MPESLLVRTVALALLGTGCVHGPTKAREVTAQRPPFLYVWSGTADSARRAAFLAVFDLRAGSPTAGKIVQVIPAGAGSRGSHHTEHQLPADGLLFANDFGAGRTYIFDLRTPGDARLRQSFTTAGPFGYPHSFVRLANGNRLATYQWQASGKPPGGLAELRSDGSAIRWSRAMANGLDSVEITPYSLDVLPALDRVVTTTTSMTENTGVDIQLWRLSDLSLLRTLRIPSTGEHAEHSEQARQSVHGAGHHLFPGEPRTLADGHTVMFATFTCGLYRLTGVETFRPVLDFVYSFPGENCAVPVVLGHYWVQTVPELRAVVVLDVSDSAHPREVSRFEIGGVSTPHWMAADESGSWLVVDSGSPVDPEIHILRFDRATGGLSAAPDVPVLSMGHVEMPGMGDIVGMPHGAVFAH
jgi:hypothetical protein